MDDPYFDRNFLTQRHILMGERREVWNASSALQLERRTRTWIYETQTELDPARSYQLVVGGIKMGASIAINGIQIGNVTDQFLRYEFNVNETTIMHGDKSNVYSRIAKEAKHGKINVKLSITFDPAIATDGRFTACSGGWDWAPYSRAGDERGSRVYTFGIVQPIFLIEIDDVLIKYVVPKITYIGEEIGDYPSRPMLDGPHHDFRVDVDVHIMNHKDTRGDRSQKILLRTDFCDEIQTLHVPGMDAGTESIVTLSLLASKNSIHLWWPNGYGDQPLYKIYVAFLSQSHRTSGWIQRTIGFRTCHLVTIDDTNTTLVKEMIANQTEGSGHHGMYFRVNGALIWARGANVVPMDQLEGRLTDDAHRIMVQSAAKANMNMLRVWGGGMILPLAFYDACDEWGILLYHDMMFVEEQFHGAYENETFEKEIRHSVRSLMSHPSIVLWSGCNECTVEMGTPTEVYATFVMQVVAEEDHTRIIWPSCPSDSGWKTGVWRITGKPNGEKLTTYPRNEEQSKLEVHGPYQHGFSKSYPSVNGHDDGRNYTIDTPPTLKVDKDIGPSFPNRFVSEFGISSFSSFESMSSTISSWHWGIHGAYTPNNCSIYDQNVNICQGENILAERNYACDSHIDAFFGSIDDQEVSEHYFKAQLFHCMLATALWLKAQIEILRSTNSFGALIWQLNENWPTGGWGLVEYGSKQNQTGQSVGGRWKPVMHLLSQSLFRHVFVACGQDGLCYCRNDGIAPFVGKVVAETWSSIRGELVANQSQRVLLDGGISHTGECHEKCMLKSALHFADYCMTEWFQLERNVSDLSEVVLLSLWDSKGSLVIEDEVVLWSAPKDIRATYMTATIAIVEVFLENRSMNIVLESDQLVLYVVLTTVESGLFDCNTFVMKPHVKTTVKFVFSNERDIDVDTFRAGLRVEHLGTYL